MSLCVSNEWSLKLFESLADVQILTIERSAKFSYKSISTDRFIVAPVQKNFTAEQLTTVLKKLAFPESYFSKVMELFEKTSQIGFGFEHTGSGSVYRLYIEFLNEYEPDFVKRKGLLYTGFKWLCDDPSKIKCTNYDYAPSFDGTNYEQIVQGTFLGPRTDFTDVVLSAVKRPLELIPPHKRVFTCASENVGNRRSFDVNLYESKQRVSFVNDELTNIASLFNIEPQITKNFLEEIQNAYLGHISSGVDTYFNPFFTLYFDDYTDFVEMEQKKS